MRMNFQQAAENWLWTTDFIASNELLVKAQLSRWKEKPTEKGSLKRYSHTDRR